MNPRAAINDLLPFQGSPFSHLGTSPAEFIKCIQFIELLLETEKVGFEPTAPFGVTGFQDRLLKPLGHLSKRCLNSIPKIQMLVNNFFLFLHENIYSSPNSHLTPFTALPISNPAQHSDPVHCALHCGIHNIPLPRSSPHCRCRKQDPGSTMNTHVFHIPSASWHAVLY